ncbi:heme exporter protein CcmD [Amaricoccus macauensis]|uniref:heme exporter protein CcmD n=1 Tax=Amaricoccus macauensis TaxID=57001 RepID=UPI003C7DC163
MIPDLGRYSITILGAYGITIALIGGLAAFSILRSKRVRQALDRAEAEVRGRRNG